LNWVAVFIFMYEYTSNIVAVALYQL